MTQRHLRVIPVVDLMGGQVVRGVGGDRGRYAPVESCFAHDSSPTSVVAALVERFSATSVYVADLDAIQGAEPDWSSLDKIAECGIQVWLDCGIGSAQVAAAVQRQAATRPYLDRLFVGLESVRGVSDLAAALATIGSEKVVFSLDLKQGRPFTQAKGLEGLPPLEIAKAAQHVGFERMLVLDLTFVGTGRGVGVVQLCQQLRSLFPQLEILAGGGVRAIADIQLLADAGCNGVLVATALHDGSIIPSDLACYQL